MAVLGLAWSWPPKLHSFCLEFTRAIAWCAVGDSWGYRDWTQDLAYTRQVLHHLSYLLCPLTDTSPILSLHCWCVTSGWGEEGLHSSVAPHTALVVVGQTLHIYSGARNSVAKVPFYCACGVVLWVQLEASCLVLYHGALGPPVNIIC